MSRMLEQDSDHSTPSCEVFASIRLLSFYHALVKVLASSYRHQHYCLMCRSRVGVVSVAILALMVT